MDMCACLLHACMNIQYGSRCFGAEDISGLHLGCPQMRYCCIRGRKLSNTGILHSVCKISPYPECSHTTRTSPEWMLSCDVVVMYIYILNCSIIVYLHCSNIYKSRGVDFIK